MSDKPAEPASPALASAQRLRDSVEQMRKRSDLAAKALGTLGTTAVTTFGIAKADDIFPVPGGLWAELVAALIIVSLIALGIVVLLFARRLWHVSDMVFTRSDVDKMDLGDKSETKIVGDLYADMAALNQTPTLSAYEARGQRWLRIAKRLEDPVRRKALLADAQEIRDDLQVVQARAAALIVRRRGAEAVRSKPAIALYVTFVVALVTSGAAADYLKGRRDTDSEKVALAKSCAAVAADLASAKVQLAGHLPGACHMK